MTKYGLELHMISQESIKDVLDYSAASGEFRWKKRFSTRRAPGDLAGCSDGRYISITVFCKRHLAHRLAWFYVYGEWPSSQIDHINGIKTDNRIENLRVVSPSENQQNQFRPHRTNTTGRLGVVPVRNKFRAQIWVNGSSKNLGTYETAEKAHDAYVSAKRNLHAGCTL